MRRRIRGARRTSGVKSRSKGGSDLSLIERVKRDKAFVVAQNDAGTAQLSLGPPKKFLNFKMKF